MAVPFEMSDLVELIDCARGDIEERFNVFDTRLDKLEGRLIATINQLGKTQNNLSVVSTNVETHMANPGNKIEMS